MDQIYQIASAFCIFCGKDREAQLKKLLKAENAVVRVAGAVYLYFENQEAARKALEEFASLPEEPGAWAALSLVRQGDKSAMQRAMEVFNSPTTEGYDRYTKASFGTLLLSILSNSAKQSLVEQPPILTDFISSKGSNDVGSWYYEALRGWWAKHEPNIMLSDPWL